MRGNPGLDLAYTCERAVPSQLQFRPDQAVLLIDGVILPECPIGALARRLEVAHQCGGSSPPICKAESETPSGRTAFGSGIDFSICEIDTRSSSIRLVTGAGSDWLREMFEVRELDLQRHGSAAVTGILAVTPDLVDELQQFGDHRLEFAQIQRERIFGADRFSDPVCPDWPFVPAA
jgi:hypothetical protein